MATGDIRIDALVEASRTTLATNHINGTGAVITYSFLSSAPASLGVYDFRGLTDAQKGAVRTMLGEVSTQVGISFKEVTTGGVLQYGTYTGRSGIPSNIESKAESITDANGSFVWLNWQVPEIANLANGYGKQLVLHETAHSLGLKHPQAYSGFDSGPYLPDGTATAANTIMAYNGGNTDKLGSYDVIALQYLYGAPGTPAPATNAIKVTSATTIGSYFNDTLSLDVNSLSSSVRVQGLTGTDTLSINVASSTATFQTDLKQFTYTKANGSFAGVYLDSVERIQFTDKTIALDIEGNAGQTYRLYKAAFDRKPDAAGLGYWLNQMDQGASLKTVAEGFVASNEFTTLNGTNPTSTQLTTNLYQHVLGRAPDQTGLAYWVAQLDNRQMSTSEVLMGFAESTENKIAVSGQIQGGIEYVAVS
ncbi:DUF4214 domain-containing protein [Pseudomonas putida]|uniref:DUF4214 domain-containing protein n=1 Tax=Pseudomonas putida TaxID=303 RepID=UPI00370C19B9